MTIDTDHRTTTYDDVTIGLLFSADQMIAQLTAQVGQLGRVVQALQKRLRDNGLDELVPELLPRLVRWDE